MMPPPPPPATQDAGTAASDRAGWKEANQQTGSLALAILTLTAIAIALGIGSLLIVGFGV